MKANYLTLTKLLEFIKATNWSSVEQILHSCNKIDINFGQKENAGKAILWLTAFYRQWSSVEIMLDKWDNPPDVNAAPLEGPLKGKTVLWLTAANGPWKLVKKMLNYDPDINASPQEGNKKGETVLLLAAASKDSEEWNIVDDMLNLEHSEPDINAAAQEGDDRGRSVLWFTIFHEKWDRVNKMLAKHFAASTMKFDKSQFLLIDVDMVRELMTSETVTLNAHNLGIHKKGSFYPIKHPNSLLADDIRVCIKALAQNQFIKSLTLKNILCSNKLLIELTSVIKQTNTLTDFYFNDKTVKSTSKKSSDSLDELKQLKQIIRQREQQEQRRQFITTIVTLVCGCDSSNNNSLLTKLPLDLMLYIIGFIDFRFQYATGKSNKQMYECAEYILRNRAYVNEAVAAKRGLKILELKKKKDNNKIEFQFFKSPLYGTSQSTNLVQEEEVKRPAKIRKLGFKK